MAVLCKYSGSYSDIARLEECQRKLMEVILRRRHELVGIVVNRQVSRIGRTAVYESNITKESKEIGYIKSIELLMDIYRTSKRIDVSKEEECSVLLQELNRYDKQMPYAMINYLQCMYKE